MKTAITTPPAAESALTAHTPLPWPKSECARYTNGQCMTSSCLKRGGWKKGGVVDYSKATCEAHELIAAHAAAQQRIVELEKALQAHDDLFCSLSSADFSEGARQKIHSLILSARLVLSK